ncbi:MAG: hypothetical protein ACKN9J_04925 [Holophagaceae bacterium]|jgi:uncharacterized protein (UPF0335 family)
MELPENIKHLVEELGDSLMEALAENPKCKELIQDIQAHQFDLVMMLEATVALRKKDNQDAGEEFEKSDVENGDPETHPHTEGSWSEADKQFLKSFRILPN